MTAMVSEDALGDGWSVPDMQGEDVKAIRSENGKYKIFVDVDQNAIVIQKRRTNTFGSTYDVIAQSRIDYPLFVAAVLTHVRDDPEVEGI